MKNLIQFLIKNFFFIFFIILEVLAFIFIFNNNSYQKTAFISASNSITGNILEKVSSITAYTNLKQDNESLLKENAMLHSKLKESNITMYSYERTFIDTNSIPLYSYHSARVISNSFQNRNNYLILDKGSLDGIKKEMGVISPDGIVGIVNKVSPHFCTVISILHKQSAIDAKILSNGYTGTSVWDGKNYRKGQLTNIPSNANFKKGDLIVTSGNSTIFPPGVNVGYINDFELKSGNLFYDINFTYSVDYNKLNYVYIVTNIMKDELTNLMEGNNHE